MIAQRMVVTALGLVAMGSASTLAQTSSLGARQRQDQANQVALIPLRESPPVKRNVVYDRYSWISTPPSKPKKYKVGDLITIIVRERRKFEAEAELKTKKEFDIQSQLDAFIKLTQGGVGSADFRRGKPTIDYRYGHKIKAKGDTEREDRFTTRLTGQIIDVKPNGLLVFEARARIEHDDEISTITFTGTCRKEDVTADNTILSTQVADKEVTVRNEGALRASTSRGWIPKLLDLLRPI